MAQSVGIYDSTLDAGMRGCGISLPAAERVAVAELLGELGLTWIDVGFPATDPVDMETANLLSHAALGEARVVVSLAPGHEGLSPDDDARFASTLAAGTGAVRLRVIASARRQERIWGCTPEQTLEQLARACAWLRPRVDELIVDAEHFFDGLAEQTPLAAPVVHLAGECGADLVLLSDNRGSLLPDRGAATIRRILAEHDVRIGVRTSNDCDIAVSVAAACVEAGAEVVAGCLNGYGERCGQVRLSSVIPLLQHRYGRLCVAPEKLKNLTRSARRVDRLCGVRPVTHRAYVGADAFVLRWSASSGEPAGDAALLEHIDPASVGNERRITGYTLPGRTGFFSRARELGIDLDATNPNAADILRRLNAVELDTYAFDGAEATLWLLLREAQGRRTDYFCLDDLDVTIARGRDAADFRMNNWGTSASIKLSVGNLPFAGTAIGSGPVDAMTKALRRVLLPTYPQLDSIRLHDFRVAMHGADVGTESKVRVTLQVGDGDDVWGTVGVSPNIVQASWQAIADAFEYRLARDEERSGRTHEVR